MGRDPDDYSGVPAIEAYQEWLHERGYERCVEASPVEKGEYVFVDDDPLDDFLADHEKWESSRQELENYTQNEGPWTAWRKGSEEERYFEDGFDPDLAVDPPLDPGPPADYDPNDDENPTDKDEDEDEDEAPIGGGGVGTATGGVLRAAPPLGQVGSAGGTTDQEEAGESASSRTPVGSPGGTTEREEAREAASSPVSPDRGLREEDRAGSVGAEPDRPAAPPDPPSGRPEDGSPTLPPSLGNRLELKRDPGPPCIGAEDYADAIADLLRGAKGEASLALLGDWGRGKTFLANLVAKSLQETHECVRFSAWRYRNKPELWVHLYEAFREGAQHPSWFDAVPRAFRAAARRHGVWPLFGGLLCLALAAVPLSALLGVLLPVIGVVGALRLFFIWRKSGHKVSGLARQFVEAPRHNEKLGLQASLADDLKALVLGWTKPLDWSRWKLAGYGLVYLTLILTVQAALWVGLNEPKAGTWKWLGDVVPDSVRFYPPQWLLITGLIVIGVVALVAPVWLFARGHGKGTVLLVVDDLDRVSLEELLDILESIKVFLEDDDLSSKVQILSLVEERAFKSALLEKYRHLMVAEGDQEHLDPLTPQRIVEENAQKLFLAWLRLPPLDDREQREVLSAFLGMPEVEEEGLAQAERSLEAARRRAREAAGVNEAGGVAALVAESADPRIGDLSSAVKRDNRRLVDRLRPDPPVATAHDGALSPQEKQALVDALETLNDSARKHRGTGVGPRTIQSFVFRYQLARRLLRARGFAVAPAKLTEALAASMGGGGPPEVSSLTSHLAFLEENAIATVLKEIT